jgi:predicted amidohydrolase YtcJ
MMLGLEGLEEARWQGFSSQVGENQLRLGGVKIILDKTTGQLHPTQAELNEMVLKSHRLGMQVALHAIEERDVGSACTSIAYALEKLPRSDHRHRIEHCSVCTHTLAERLASLGIMVVTQPPFIYFNGDRYLSTVPGHQLKHLYPIGTLMKNGVQVAGSSDSPTTSPDPLLGVYAAVTRMTRSGQVILPEERISPLEALGMYAHHGARASFEEMTKGSITPGKLADLVVLSGDPTRVAPEEIKDIEVEMTIINGEVVWRRGTSQ